MVTRDRRAKRRGTQGAKGTGARRPVRITADTPYGECSERLTAFGGLLVLGYRSGPRITWHATLFGGVFQGDARQSPLVHRDSFLNAGVGFSYRFGE